MVSGTRLHPDDLIAPLFVREGIDEPQPIASLPGQFQHSRASLREEVRQLKDLGIPAVILFTIYYSFFLPIEAYWEQLFVDSLIKVPN